MGTNVLNKHYIESSGTGYCSGFLFKNKLFFKHNDKKKNIIQ